MIDPVWKKKKLQGTHLFGAHIRLNALVGAHTQKEQGLWAL